MSVGLAGSAWVRVKARALRAAQPLNALCELTYACSLRCSFCCNPRHHDLRGLSTDEWLAVVDELHAVGVLTVTLSGGDPLTHPGFLAIAGRVRLRGLALRVLTNGMRISDEVAEALAALDPLSVEMSLHGSRAATHDRATEVAGSFDSLRLAIERLLRHSVPVVVKTPLTCLNEHELEEIVALGETYGCRHIVDPNLTPRDDGVATPLAFRPSKAGVERLYRMLAQKGTLPDESRERGGVNCGLGRVTLAIDPEGQVYPCPQWRHSALGNVLETPLGQLWRGSAVRTEAAAIASQANDLLVERGGAVARFPYCPALAFQHTGDALLPDAEHEQRALLVDALRKASA